MTQAASTSGSAAAVGAGRSVSESITAPSAAIPQRPRVRAYGIASATAASARASIPTAGFACSARQSAPATRPGRLLPAMPSPSGGASPVKGSGDPPQAGDDGGDEHAGGGLQRAAPRRPEALHRERQQAERADRREQRAEREQQAAERLLPHQRDPDGRERRVEQREPERDVAEREDRHRERGDETETRAGERERRGERRQPGGEVRRVEGQQRRSGRGGDRGERRGAEPWSDGRDLEPDLRRCGALRDDRCGFRRVCACRSASASSRALGRRAGFSVERAVDEDLERLGQVGSHRLQRRRARLDRLRRLDERGGPERVVAGERLPEQRPRRPRRRPRARRSLP